MRGSHLALVALLACASDPPTPKAHLLAAYGGVITVPAHDAPDALVPPAPPPDLVSSAPAPDFPKCPPAADWDGAKCNPKEPCSAGSTWNGRWCLDPAVERREAAQFTQIDAAVHGRFAPEVPGYEYTGATEDVVGRRETATSPAIRGKFFEDEADAKRYDTMLDGLASGALSPGWRIAATSRQGRLYDELWSALDNARPPRIAYFTARQLALLTKLAQTTSPMLQNQAADLRAAVAQGWQKKKALELDAVARLAVSRYATAVALARLYGVTSPEVAHAKARLSDFTGILGEPKMRAFVTETKAPPDLSGMITLSYTDGMYQ